MLFQYIPIKVVLEKFLPCKHKDLKVHIPSTHVKGRIARVTGRGQAEIENYTMIFNQ